jgi:nucleoside-diphosphate-sugar epimerase
MRVLIIGCGYVGLPLGAELVRAGHEVFGLRRSRAAEAELRAAGIQPVFGDITDAGSLRPLPGTFDWVVNCAAAGGGGPEAYRQVYVEGNRNLLSWLAPGPGSGFSEARRQDAGSPGLVYTSSTSVYGQNDGSWVTEASPTEPAAETGTILLEAERLLLEAHRTSGFPATILRLAGIYGPGRGFWFKQFMAGQATMPGDGGRFLNMIHRDDVAAAIVAVLERGRPGEIYNVVDDEPVTQKELFRWLSKRLGKALPQPGPAADTPRKRGATNKRISNGKLREQLGYQCRFPTFREGFETVQAST